MKKIVTKQTVSQMIKLSNLKIDPKEQGYFTKQFNETLETIDNLKKLDTKGIVGTNHVTGLTNVFRRDRVKKERVLTQEQALSNAKKTHKGYFVVKAIFDEQ